MSMLVPPSGWVERDLPIRPCAFRNGGLIGPPVSPRHTQLPELVSSELVVALMGFHFLQNAAQVVGLRRLQRRELFVGCQLLLPELLADRQHVPVVQICGRWGAECTAQLHG